MPRIIGVDIPEDKKILYALQYIYGVGSSRAEKVLSKAQVEPDKRAKDLDTNEINRIQRALDDYMLEGDLRRQVNDNIDRLKRIQSYRGMRHKAGLPVRGQRTRTNARNARGMAGQRNTVGSTTKKMSAEMREEQRDQ